MTHEIQFSAGSSPGWEAIRDQIVRLGETPILRMIDGMPAFPDEVPEIGWRELRVGLKGGMITLRRTGEGLVTIAWGSTDEELVQSWNRLTLACASAGQGRVQTPQGLLSAVEFAAVSNLPSA